MHHTDQLAWNFPSRFHHLKKTPNLNWASPPYPKKKKNKTSVAKIALSLPPNPKIMNFEAPKNCSIMPLSLNLEYTPFCDEGLLPCQFYGHDNYATCKNPVWLWYGFFFTTKKCVIPHRLPTILFKLYLVLFYFWSTSNLFTWHCFQPIYPLVTVLLCVSQKAFFLSSWPSFLNMCLGTLKVMVLTVCDLWENLVHVEWLNHH